MISIYLNILSGPVSINNSPAGLEGPVVDWRPSQQRAVLSHKLDKSRQQGQLSTMQLLPALLFATLVALTFGEFLDKRPSVDTPEKNEVEHEPYSKGEHAYYKRPSGYRPSRNGPGYGREPNYGYGPSYGYESGYGRSP